MIFPPFFGARISGERSAYDLREIYLFKGDFELGIIRPAGAALRWLRQSLEPSS